MKVGHHTQCRNMPAVKLFTYPQNDSGVDNKSKSMSREGEIWANAAAPDVTQADSTYPYDGLVQLENCIPLIVLNCVQITAFSDIAAFTDNLT